MNFSENRIMYIAGHSTRKLIVDHNPDGWRALRQTNVVRASFARFNLIIQREGSMPILRKCAAEVYRYIYR